MSVQSLASWASRYVQNFALSTLEGAVIGVDATYYLNQILNEDGEEPLKVATGGIPFCFAARVEADLLAAERAGIKLIFIFNGLDYVNKTPAGAESSESKNAHEDGWSLYMQGDSVKSVASLGKAQYSPDLVSRLFQKILHTKGVTFMVAPFSSLAFLAYLYHLEQGQPIDAMMASPDAFLFDVDKTILSIDRKESTFSWLSRQDCINAAGNPTPNLFKDAQLLLGSSFLPTFPPLSRSASAPNGVATIRDAVIMLSRSPVLHLCNQFEKDPVIAALEYADRYKKALMTIRHHVIITPSGSVQPMDLEHAPGDVHAFVGQRLPDELIYYMSKGLLAPEVPNWLTTGEIKLSLPGGAIDCEPFRKFIIEQLNQLRLQSIKLLSEPLHYYLQNREVITRPWAGPTTTDRLKDLPSIRDKARQWKVKESSLPSSKVARPPTSILSCLRLLKDKEFAQTTISKGRVDYPALVTQNEIISNVFWRFLQIRGFVNDQHQLTSWGHILEATLSVMDGGSRKEEQGIIAVEMLKLGVFNTQSPTGTAVPSSDKAYEHKMHTNLLSKIACLGRIKHQSAGYIGPLDQSLLTFAWQITAIRQSLRDLCETILSTMFLDGTASRSREDWSDLPMRLPFSSDNGATLGIVVKTYLDAIKDNSPSPSSLEDFKQKLKSQEEPYKWFGNVESNTIHKSLDTAWTLFDAVLAGVKAGEKDVKDAAIFTAAKTWLSSRR